jgi:Laminin B (Domain IV)
MKIITILISLALIILAPAGGLHADSGPQASTFDTNAEGWLVGDFYNRPDLPDPVSPTYSSTGGNPGGYINWSQPPEHLEQWSAFMAPAKFLGDMSGYYGGTLQFDLRYSGQSQQGGEIELQDSVVLEGNVEGVPTQIRYRKDKPTDNAGWSTFTIPLIVDGSTSGSGWYNITEPDNPWELDPHSPANETTLRSILQNLTALRIDADWSTKKDIADLDNVRLVRKTMPVPVVILLLGDIN